MPRKDSMTIKEDIARIREESRKITPWTQRPGWVAREQREIALNRLQRLEREKKPARQEVTPELLGELTRHTRDVLAEHGQNKPPRSLQAMFRDLGAKTCTGCLEVLERETGFNAGDSRCKTCVAEEGARYREENREQINQRRREAYAADPEKHRERTRQWIADNPDYHEDYYEKYKLERPLVKKLNQGYHRAVKAENPAYRITQEQLLDYWKAERIDSTRCYYTGEPLTAENISIDHGQPISLGGGHVLENLFPCTIKANLDKSTRTVAEYLEVVNA